ncbi:hypothetical protein [Bradyrhizobium sp. Tv2a-2]|uniref:hypothetical protein n=1 Tax=Bradyrhizobium sp. Tv2a-2 TaxID=113395 RepID=UPI000466DFC3|nr:hypothetical protein [Bradyrhizobium sp. Tv2a-2]
MKAALLSLALLGSQAALASDRVPELNVEATCKATTATDKAMGLVLAQSYEGCMSDETSARTQLVTLWQTTSASVRNECTGEAVVGGTQSYVDLLTCIQMSDDANPRPQLTLRGASKNRNTPH